MLLLFPVPVLLSTCTAHAGQSHPNVASDFWSDCRYLAGEPDFYAVIGGIGLTPPLFHSAFNREDVELTENWRGTTSDRLFSFGATMGQAAIPVAASVLCMSIGRLDHSGKAETFGSRLLRAQAINGILTLSMKGTINRIRPNGHPFSYPSGHTSVVFTTAAVIEHDFGPKAGIPAFLAAGYVALSRMQGNKHYLSDVIAGGMLGSYIGFKVSGRTGAFERLRVAPASMSDGKGIDLAISF
jgi:membrane-associated phospholipid phosphatase